jgi:hypothetical protein
MRCTVLGSTPNLAAIFRTLSPVSLRAFKAVRIRASVSDATPSHDDVEFTPGCGLMEGIEGRALILGLCTGNAVVLVDLHRDVSLELPTTANSQAKGRERPYCVPKACAGR